jgi:glycolate oxidase FAD binding subunit
MDNPIRLAPQDNDLAPQLQDAVRAAHDHRTPLCIQGGGSKHFLGRECAGELLAVGSHRGIVNYAPAELVLTARCGTPLSFIERTLAEGGQMLAFEPPAFGKTATLGGTIACGLSGPRRPYAGALRDSLLGIKCLSGEGKILRFGGEVVKNVAGFDAFRLMAGAYGTLGVLLEASFKVLPLPACEVTLSMECDADTALREMNRWASQRLPLGATAYDGQRLFVRLEGSEKGVASARKRLGGEVEREGPAFWRSVREHRHPFFQEEGALWRLSVAPATPPLPIVGRWFVEWGGAQRWLRTALAPKFIRQMAVRHGGHAAVFRGGDREAEVFHPLAPAIAAVHKNLKRAFDPRGILNPGRMYKNL